MVTPKENLFVLNRPQGPISLPATNHSALFKYMPPPEETDSFAEENIYRLIVDEEVRLTGPLEVNDPADCNPHYVNDIEMKDIRKYMTFLRTKVKNKLGKTSQEIALLKEFPSRQVVRQMKNVNPQIIDGIRKIAEDSFKSRGFTCLPEDGLNTLMWSHYSKSHQGLCVKLKTLPTGKNLEGLAANEIPFTASFINVEYSNKRPVYTASKNLFGSDNEEIRTALLSKSSV